MKIKNIHHNREKRTRVPRQRRHPPTKTHSIPHNFLLPPPPPSRTYLLISSHSETCVGHVGVFTTPLSSCFSIVSLLSVFPSLSPLSFFLVAPVPFLSDPPTLPVPYNFPYYLPYKFFLKKIQGKKR